ncbi:monosaccharide ABC transporter substrate-binding protein (CUT2 family) [Mucilaginibacter gracilis]|uniref:histidine kinase n=1 Tax=Mucilaginibacter gracilis TaxID=423350 RepID=A0A495ITQ2_9SPHI|nr:substrate-binding domain-containing protein [Mucilaginibacter gracilis]RKR80146.1 monosaccharide ABC transporter substrate-binding protein (CUT2 family) [Mucilaginibacter gracilis]
MYNQVSFFTRQFGFWICLIIAISACRPVNKKTQYVIGFSQCVGSDLWRKTMLDEMKMELSLHPGADFVYADAEGNSKKQIIQVKNMLEHGIDLLIISPNEAQPLTEIVEQTYNKGIPVIVIDRKTASSLYTAYVGADNYQLGKMAGEYAGTILKGQVNLIEIMGLPGSSPAIERDRGFIDGIKKFSNINIRDKIYGDWLKKNAKEQLLNIKNKLPGTGAVFAHNDVMAAGAREVLNSLKLPRNIKVIGIDALPGTGGGLELVSDKVLDASLLYPTGGKEAIVTAFHILNKEAFSRDNILQSLVIDSTNVQLMKVQWNKINSQQKDIEKQKSLLEEQEAVYNSQQVILNIIVITLVLAVIFGGLAFYFLVENRKVNKSLEAKNTEILSQRNQLIELSIKAEAATEAKLNFFTNISHEFRTPLTLIISPIEDLIKNDKLQALAGRQLQLIHQNTYRLLHLVNQLIDYRKIEYDKQQLQASENNLVVFLKDIVDSFRQYAQKLNVDIQFIPRDKEIKIWFDVNMLDKVFFNLISNAIKFSREKGHIQIKIQQNDGKVQIAISDNGIGLAPDEALRIFDQFYQVDHHDGKGSGIGLSLSKEIVQLHGGAIAVESQKWKGTTFTVSLPLGDAHLQKEQKIEQLLNQSDIVAKSKVYQVEVIKSDQTNSADVFSQPKEYSILIVEDNPELLLYLSEQLAKYYEIFVANNGNNALTEAYEKVPDLIIADVVMPGFSGKVLAEKLKSDLRTSHIPIILLTAQVSVEQQIEGIQSMADLYITKPFNFDYLLANIQNLIRNRVILKEHFTSDISSSEKSQTPNNLDKKFLSDFSGIVEQNLSNEKFNVDDICKVIGISRVQLYRKVKALLGCSITDYILNRRLKKAKYLLGNEGYTIAEITYMVGFSNPNYFATVFKAKYNCTPSEFRKNKVSSG